MRAADSLTTCIGAVLIAFTCVGCLTHTCTMQLHEQTARTLEDGDGSGNESASAEAEGPDVDVEATVPISPSK